MVALSGIFAGKRRQESDSAVDLRVRKTAAGQKRTIRGVQKILVRKRRDTREISLLLVIAKEEEKLIFDDRAADRAAPLLAKIRRLDAYECGTAAARKQDRKERERIACAPPPSSRRLRRFESW